MFLLDTFNSQTSQLPFASVFKPFNDMGITAPPPLELMTASEPLFGTYSQLLKFYAQHSKLSPELLLCIRYHVALQSDFKGCVSFNAQLLPMRNLAEAAPTLAGDVPTAALSDRDQKILQFVSDALFRPDTIIRQRIELLIDNGVSEQMLFEASFHGALLLMMGPLVKAFSADS